MDVLLDVHWFFTMSVVNGANDEFDAFWETLRRSRETSAYVTKANIDKLFHSLERRAGSEAARDIVSSILEVVQVCNSESLLKRNFLVIDNWDSLYQFNNLTFSQTSSHSESLQFLNKIHKSFEAYLYFSAIYHIYIYIYIGYGLYRLHFGYIDSLRGYLFCFAAGILIIHTSKNKLFSARRSKIDYSRSFSLISKIAHFLAKRFPKEWEENQHWLRDIQDSFQYLKKKGYQHWLIALLVHWYLFQFGTFVILGYCKRVLARRRH